MYLKFFHNSIFNLHMSRQYKNVLSQQRENVLLLMPTQLLPEKFINAIVWIFVNTPLSCKSRLFLNRRWFSSSIETVLGYLKNTMQLEHTRHRSPINAFVHILSTLVIYQKKSTKPSACFTHNYQLHPLFGFKISFSTLLNWYEYDKNKKRA